MDHRCREMSRRWSEEVDTILKRVYLEANTEVADKLIYSLSGIGNYMNN